MRVRRSFAVVLGAWWSVAFGVSAAPAGGVLAEETAGQPTASTAPQERPRTPVGPEEWKRRLRAAIAELSSSDAAQLEQALQALRELGGREAAEAVMNRVRLGLPPHLAELSVEVLADLNQPITTPVLVELTLHRRWQVRQKAVAALGALRVRSTVSVLLYALDDPSAEVRGASATSLGQVGDKRALPALAAALAKGVPEALFALAQLGSAQHVKLIVAHAQNDLKGSEPALRTVLKRPNLPVASKLMLVNTLKGLQTPEASALLESLRASLGKGTEPQLLAALADVGNES